MGLEPHELSESLLEALEEFRERLQHGQHPRIEEFQLRVHAEQRMEFLVQAIEAEIDFLLHPTVVQDASSSTDDDQRVEPRLELYFHRFPELRICKRSSLELVIFDYAIRRKCGLECGEDVYREMLPEYSEDIARLIKRSKNIIFKSAEVTLAKPPSKNQTTVVEVADAKVSSWKLPTELGHFLLLSHVDSGGMGAVFRALDLRTGAIVAIKVTRRSDSWSVYRFNEEIRALTSLCHPHLVKVYEVLSDASHRYFSMELVEGQTLSAWWHKQHREPRWATLRQYLSDVADAIDYLHCRGIVHADIKGNNILVSRGRVVLLDLGLAHFLGVGLDAESRLYEDRLAGTLAYLAPEIRSRNRPSAASDWFSFGVLLFELATGQLPFSSTICSEEHGLDEHDLDLLDNSKCDPQWKELCRRLLVYAPENRCGAREVLSTLNRTRSTLLSAPSFQGKIPIYGRSEVQSLLKGMIDRPRSGSSFILLRGTNGVGKTRVLSDWCHALKISQRWVIQTTASRYNANRFGFIHSLVQSLVSTSQYQVNLLELLSSDQQDVLRTAYPQLNSADLVASLGFDGNSKTLRKDISEHAAQCFLQWLSLMSRQCPIFLAWDDFHLADAASRHLVTELFRNQPSSQILAVATITEDADSNSGGHCLCMDGLFGTIADSDRAFYQLVDLPPLTTPQMSLLATHIFSCCGIERSSVKPYLARIVNASRGRPSSLFEIIQILLDTGLAPDAWSAKVDLLAQQDPIDFRFQRLSRPQQQILQFMAVANKPVAFSQLQVASRVGPDQLLDDLGELATRRWIIYCDPWPDFTVDIFNEFLRDRILNVTPPDRIARRHNRWVHVLMHEPSPPWEQIGMHLAAAGSKRRAQSAYLEAARCCLQQGNLDAARDLLQRIHQLGTPDDSVSKALQQLEAQLEIKPEQPRCP